MIYGIAILTMFVLSIVCFVCYNKKLLDDDELWGALVASFIASIFWFVAIPLAILIGGAWWIAKLISKGTKSK